MLSNLIRLHLLESSTQTAIEINAKRTLLISERSAMKKQQTGPTAAAQLQGF